ETERRIPFEGALQPELHEALELLDQVAVVLFLPRARRVDVERIPVALQDEMLVAGHPEFAALRPDLDEEVVRLCKRDDPIVNDVLHISAVPAPDNADRCQAGRARGRRIRKAPIPIAVARDEAVDDAARP